jgi:hypothetical protein
VGSIVLFLLLLDSFMLFNITVIGTTIAGLSVNPSVSTVAVPGQNISIQVRLWFATNFTGYTFVLGFDPNLLQCVSASSGGMHNARTHSVTIVDNAGGTVYVQSDAGDINKDGTVNLIDLILLAKAYGSKPGDPNWNSQADVNGNGRVDLGDLSKLASDYGIHNDPDSTGTGILLTATLNANYATGYMQPTAQCPLEILNSTIYGTGTPPHIILSSSTNGEYYAPSLPPDHISLTLMTDRSSYVFGQPISIFGNLTADGYRVKDGLVAFEVKNPNSRLVVLRTLTTSGFIGSYNVSIVSVMPCQADGTPKNNFIAGTDIAYFLVTVQDSGPLISNPTVFVNVYDSDNASLGVAWAQLSLNGGNRQGIVGIPLGSSASAGTATAYASVLTDYVDNGGVPLCSESQATFSITGNSAGSPTVMSQPPDGTYKTILQIKSSPSAAAGTYWIQAATSYAGIYATQNEQITVTS